MKTSHSFSRILWPSLLRFYKLILVILAFDFHEYAFILSYGKHELIQFPIVTEYFKKAKTIRKCFEWEGMHGFHHCKFAWEPPSANNIKFIHFYFIVERIIQEFSTAIVWLCQWAPSRQWCHDSHTWCLKFEIRLFFHYWNLRLDCSFKGRSLLPARIGGQWKGLKEDGKQSKSFFMSKVSFPYMLIPHDNWILICRQPSSC
jgi:hypothetical protein